MAPRGMMKIIRNFFPNSKSKRFTLSALISKRIKIQEPAWSHLIDFLKMRILKKNHPNAIKIEQVMTLLSCAYIYGQDGKREKG